MFSPPWLQCFNALYVCKRGAHVDAAAFASFGAQGIETRRCTILFQITVLEQICIFALSVYELGWDLGGRFQHPPEALFQGTIRNLKLMAELSGPKVVANNWTEKVWCSWSAVNERKRKNKNRKLRSKREYEVRSVDKEKEGKITGEKMNSEIVKA